MSYAFANEHPVVLTNVDEIRDTMRGLINDGVRLHAWNSFFEMSISANVLQLPGALNPPRWCDTAAAAAAMALPRALGDCGAALGLPADVQKTKRGRYLIQRLCKPTRGKRVTDAELMAELYEYCAQDVVAERAISRKIPPLSGTERQIWELDQRINTRGVHIDRALVDSALHVTEQTASALDARVHEITGGALSNVRQRQRVLDYIHDTHGYTLPGYDATAIREALNDAALPHPVRQLLEIRQQSGKTSTAKFQAIACVTSAIDNQARGLLMYHGASTGRWSGRHIQPQNLPRPSSDADTCIEAVAARDAQLLSALYTNPMDAISSCLRGTITAPAGKRLLVADYAAIEARVLAWLAGQQDVLDVFRGDGRLYEHTAAKIYRTTAESVDTEQRFVGKVAALALGYGGGAVAFQKMADAYGVEIETERAEQIKTDWREANSGIVKFWRDVERAAISAVDNSGKIFNARGIRFRTLDGYLRCRLPSGRALAYYKPTLAEGRFGMRQVEFSGTNSVTRKWERQTTYGGKLVENVTQAVARDLLAEAMLRVESAGYEIVLSVHDELIAEVPNSFGNVAEFSALMCELPKWAEGLPLTAEGFACERYRK